MIEDYIISIVAAYFIIKAIEKAPGFVMYLFYQIRNRL